MRKINFNKKIDLIADYDVIVAGGGPAGSAAAICASRMGLKTLLVEATGCLGGMGTSGLVASFGPVSDGERMLVGGFMKELLNKLQSRNAFGPDVFEDFLHRQLNRWIPFKPEILKIILDEYAVEAGVTIRFFSRIVDVDHSLNKLKGVIVSSIEGLQYFSAKTFVDATGDATLASMSGFECKVVLRDSDTVAPSTLCSLVTSMNWNDPAYGVDWKGVDHMKEKVRNEFVPKAIDDGFFTQNDRFFPGMNKIGPDSATLNAGHVFGMNPLSVEELSNGMVFGRKLAQEYCEFYKKYVPGCENIEILTTANVMGVRDSRRIVGEFELCIEDFKSKRQFSDQIAVYNRPTDVHPTNATQEEFERFLKDFHGKDNLGKGGSVGIPYSILVPKNSENLWVAGRCHSSDTKVHGSIRAQSAAYMMGQAAAAAAYQHIKTSQPACDLNTEQLVSELRRQGAYLPQEKLSKSMTR